jgi:hypothetical protein
MEETMTKIACFILTLSFAAFASCASSENPVDTTGDPDVTPDNPIETPEADIPDVPVDEIVGDETPSGCSGSDTLHLAFKDTQGDPVEGIPVALRCAGAISEAVSDASGTASFSNLDLAAVPVDFTYVHEGKARTILGLGGSRTVPDPFPITVGEVPTEDNRRMSGNVTHAQSGSYVLITSGADATVAMQDVYEMRSPMGTGLPMSVLEFTSTGSVATPIGYSLIEYDYSSTDTTGPDATAASTTFQTASVQLNYDIRPGSPLEQRAAAADTGTSTNRTYTGLRLWAADASDHAWIVGLTTSWTMGSNTDTLVFTWAPSGMAGAAEYYPGALIYDPNYMYYASLQLPDDPSTWSSSYTIHDLPRIPEATPSTPVPFDQVFNVEHPDWARTVSYHIRLSGSAGVVGDVDFMWTVLIHPEIMYFSFSDLPLPSSVQPSDIVPSLNPYLGVSAVAYDADPYENYVLWTDDQWASNHYQSAGIDSRYHIQPP